MTRPLTATFSNELANQIIYPAFFLEAVFLNQVLYLWTGTGDYHWGGITWLGNGWLHDITGLGENDDLGVEGIEAILTGVPSSVISLIMSSQQGDIARVHFGLFNENFDLIDTPLTMFEGALDVPTIQDNPQGAMISLTYESPLIAFERSKEYRYNTESQKLFDPTDKGFEFVPTIQSWKGQWGPTEKQIERRKRRAEKKRGQKKSNTRR